MRRIILACLFFLTTTALAQDHRHETPYAGLEGREIKALSDADIEGLLTGAGMGYALAAELNGYPGPKHVLELAEELGLTDEQREQTEALFATMQEEAIAHGKQLIELEAELEEAFASKDIIVEMIASLTGKIGAMEGALRAVHLKTHLEMTPLLTMHQRHLYQQLRGYGEGGMDHRNMDHSQMDH